MVVTLIVMEPGSEWPGHVGDSETTVVVGGDDEGLLERARQRLDSIRKAGQRVRLALLTCNGTRDTRSVARRSEVAQELFAAVAEAGFGRLVMTTSKQATMGQRCELLALAGDLSHGPRCTTTTVSVRFGSDHPHEIGLTDRVGTEMLASFVRVPAYAQ